MDAMKSKLIWLVGLLILTAICGIYKHFGIPEKSPLVFFTIYIVVVVPMLLLWWWNAKIELIKRGVLAVPLVLLLITISKILGVETPFSIYTGLLLFFFLLIKADNWKVHFVITFAIAIIFTLLNAYVGHSRERGDSTLYEWFVISAIVISLGTFYIAYWSTISSKEPIKFRLIFAKSTKYAIALLLMLYLLFLSNHLCWRYNISPVISFGISGLIGLSFFVVCRLFDITPSAVANTPKSMPREANHAGECECCGKTGIHQELLFKIDSGQRVCASCLKRMEQSR